tara:strand:- start:376 stop:585 length:210 start_codon:yes stop_codon:yes gene_type:complete
MSAEKIINTEQNSLTSNTPKEVMEDSGVVDINHLLARVRNEKKEENKVNMIFFGLFAALILIVGILLAL